MRFHPFLRYGLLTGLFALICAGPLKAEPGLTYARLTYDWPVLGAIDGDTLKVHLPGLPLELQPLKVRVIGIDTPESGGRGKCAAERDLANKATALTRFLINEAKAKKKKILFSDIAWDKFGGRVDARVMIGGRSLANTLISAKLARPYDGGKRKGWC